MKKILVILCFICMVVLLAGCSKTTTIDDVDRRIICGRFVVLNERSNGYFGADKSRICFDSQTKICYCFVTGGGICPYYVINEQGEPEIAVYKQNYFGE